MDRVSMEETFRRSQHEAFMRSLPDSVRASAEETYRIHGEFIRQITIAETATTPKEALEAARWIAGHVTEVAYQMCMVRGWERSWRERNSPTIQLADLPGEDPEQLARDLYDRQGVPVPQAAVPAPPNTANGPKRGIDR
jgi:hypothetical protein